jgi:hypothetical protein
MIIDNFDIRGTMLRPTEAEAPLIVYPDAVCSGPVARQRLQPVSRRDAKIIQCHRNLQLAQLPPRNIFDRNEASHALSVSELFSFMTAEGNDHQQ